MKRLQAILQAQLTGEMLKSWSKAEKASELKTKTCKSQHKVQQLKLGKYAIPK